MKTKTIHFSYNKDIHEGKFRYNTLNHQNYFRNELLEHLAKKELFEHKFMIQWLLDIMKLVLILSVFLIFGIAIMEEKFMLKGTEALPVILIYISILCSVFMVGQHKLKRKYYNYINHARHRFIYYGLYGKLFLYKTQKNKIGGEDFIFMKQK